MRPGPQLPTRFFARCPSQVAPELVGCWLVRRLETGARLIGRLVEVEAYLGDGSDPSAHCHRGRTPRNESMFGPPGRLYAYLSYGIHICANAVCQPTGQAGGVLLRAVEPLAGEDTMRELRGLSLGGDARLTASGPGRLAEAFGLSLEHDGRRFDRSWLALHRPPEALPPGAVGVGPRVGLSKATDLPLRFVLKDNRFVTPWRRPARPSKSRAASIEPAADRRGAHEPESQRATKSSSAPSTKSGRSMGIR